jgi:hypothetical protein
VPVKEIVDFCNKINEITEPQGSQNRLKTFHPVIIVYRMQLDQKESGCQEGEMKRAGAIADLFNITRYL